MSSRLYEQLLAISAYAAGHDSAPKRHNPYPPGLVVAGSGTDKILKYLEKVSPSWVPLREIIRNTGLSHNRAGWSLRYLIVQEKIESRELGGKSVNSRYLRYRVRP
jgi:hypothetical protein